MEIIPISYVLLTVKSIHLNHPDCESISSIFWTFCEVIEREKSQKLVTSELLESNQESAENESLHEMKINNTQSFI